MTSFDFERGATPYSNRDALLDDYTPDKLVGRDDELQEYHGLLEPVIWGDQPNNIFLYGKAGVGKTAATRFLLDRLEANAEDYEDISLTTLHINCDGLTSSYQVARRIVNELRDPDDQISEHGYSQAAVYEMMWNEIDAIGDIFLIVLDEVDHIRKDDSILYQLSRARENENLEHSKIGVIGISNDMTFRDRLSPKTKSSLCERELSFSDYDADELRAVLRQREAVAFKDNALEDGVIPKCAAVAARETGDAREALDYLLFAGDKAREDNSETVTEEHVERAREDVEQKAVAEGLSDRNEQARLVAYALATLEAEGETPARTNDVYDRYQNLARRASDNPLSVRWVREHLDSLVMLGILTANEKNRGEGGGRYKEYKLNQSVEAVVTALEETIELVGIHESVTGYIS